MTKRLLLATALVALACPAYAGLIGNEGNDNSINNNSGIANTGSINGSVLNNGVGSGSTHNTNTNVNTAVSGSNASSRSSSRSNASAKQAQAQKQSVRDSGNSENANTAVVNQNYKRNPVSTAYSAQLVAAEDTCMGSSSVGGQGVGFGLSVGSTWSDADCVRRKDARELHNMGYRPAAVALMCQSANVAKAMATAGTPCGVGVEPAAGESVGYVREDRGFQNGSRKN